MSQDPPLPEPSLQTLILPESARRHAEEEWLAGGVFDECVQHGNTYFYKLPTGQVVVSFRDFRPGREAQRSLFSRLTTWAAGNGEA